MNGRITAIERADVPTDLIQALKKFHGLPPYNDGGNFLVSDGIYLNSLRAEYGEGLLLAAEVYFIKPLKDALADATARVERSLGRGTMLMPYTLVALTEAGQPLIEHVHANDVRECAGQFMERHGFGVTLVAMFSDHVEDIKP